MTRIGRNSQTTTCMKFINVREGLDDLERVLGGYDALTILIGSCTQRLDGNDTTLPLAPETLATLLETMGNACRTQLRQIHDSVDAYIDLEE